jgi:hypothetical protein
LLPWVSARGAGLLAHATAHAGETADGLASRVGRALGQAFYATDITDASALAGKANLLSRLAHPDVTTMLLSHISEAWATEADNPLWTFGSLESIGRVSPFALVERLRTIRASPLRLSVLANAGEGQGASMQSAIERWIPRWESSTTSACPEVPTTDVPKGRLDALSFPVTEILIAVPIARESLAKSELLATLLNDEKGPLASLIGPFATDYHARVIDSLPRAALLIKVDCPLANIEPVANAIREVFASLRTTAVSGDVLKAVVATRDRDRIAYRLDPAHRLALLFEGELDAPAVDVSPDQLKEFAADALVPERVSMVIAR